MAVFQWKGIQGNQITSGEIEAANQEEATAKLQAQSIIPTNVVMISGKAQGANKIKKKRTKSVKNKDLMMFTKKFATMVQAGLPILKTLHMLESQTVNPGLKAVVGEVYREVEGGSPLSDAFEKHPKVFDNIYVNILRAGESSGKLTTFLFRLVTQLEKTEKIRAKVKGALSYPIILLMVAFGVITIMMIKVVPVFQQMFSNLGNSLPGPTQLIVDVSEFFRDPMKGGLLFGTVIAVFMAIKYWLKTNQAARYRFHKILLRVPVVGDVIIQSTVAKVAMVQGNLSAAGVPVLEALSIVSKTINNLVFKEAFKHIQTGVSSGQPLSMLYAECPVFPQAFSQMLAVGEETGSMDEMLEAVAKYYEEEFDMIVDRLSEILEPFMIVFMGLTVGFIIVAMYMPIFSMGSMIK